VLLGPQGWDMILLVEYPSQRAFLEMIGSEEYQGIAHMRTEALSRGELHPTRPHKLDGMARFGLGLAGRFTPRLWIVSPV
jgi:hypothetical protein